MICDLIVGATWDNNNEVLLDWDKRIPCTNGADYIYTCGVPSFKGARFICVKNITKLLLSLLELWNPMSLYSKQKFYCNCCGKEMFCDCLSMMGGKFLGWKVCSVKCIREIRWRETLSIMNKEYYPHPDPNYYNPDYNPDTGKKY